MWICQRKVVRKIQSENHPTRVVALSLEIKNQKPSLPNPQILGPIWVEIRLYSVTE